MRVLWVTAEPPDRAGGGGNIRQAHLLTAVAAQHETHLLLAGTLADAAIRDAVASMTELPVAPPSRPGSTAGRRLLDLRLAGPEGPPDRYDGKRAREVLAPWLAATGGEDRYDVVVVQHGGLTPVLPRRRVGRWVAEMHNVESATLAALAAVAPGARQRWVRSAQARRARRLERWIAGAYDHVVTVSSEDALTFDRRSFVVPNGVDVGSWSPTPLPEKARVVFTATLNYLPNVDGIEWFARDVWPRVRAAVPDAQLDVVGRSPVDAVVGLGRLEGVEVHPDVRDVRPFVAAARACVVPLRVGSGSRLKVLEAWAAGRPVVGTSVGLAGLAVEDGRNAVLADRPEDLAASLVTVLRDQDLARRLAQAGRKCAEQRYDWTVLGAAYAEWLGSLG